LFVAKAFDKDADDIDPRVKSGSRPASTFEDAPDILIVDSLIANASSIDIVSASWTTSSGAEFNNISALATALPMRLNDL
jgi:hypothetical protein